MSRAPRAWVRWAVLAAGAVLLSVGVARARSEAVNRPADNAVLWGNAPHRSAVQAR